MKIILISGKARHGKDTLGAYIKEAYEEQGMKVCQLQYASYIKYYAEKYFGWDGKEETKPRELLQKLGTDIIRHKIDNMFHVNRIMQDIKVLDYFYDIAIITDVREPIEITTPKEMYENVVSINIFRPNFESNMTDTQKKHFTEVALDNFNDYDYKVINDSTLEALKEKAIKIVRKEVKQDEENER